MKGKKKANKFINVRGRSIREVRKEVNGKAQSLRR